MTMRCPNCGEQMSPQNADNQTVLHCRRCGGTFFEENGINRVSLTSAQRLSREKESDELSGDQKMCPKDNAQLAPIEHGESIPQHVTILGCPQCQGTFAYPQDLIAFKEAQTAKVAYFKTWKMPLPSLKAVMISFTVLLVSISFVRFLFRYQQQYLQPTQAEDVVRNVSASKSGRYLFVSFKTATPFTSKIYLLDSLTGQTVETQIQAEPTTLHFFTTAEINPNNEILYEITLQNEEGRIWKTERKRLEFK
jgi:DNA-directed RNA polymerase subunit M/transcription elongation factor TFIIS